MSLIRKKYLVVTSAFICLGLTGGESIAAEKASNEFLDMDISQLLDVMITSVSKKEQRLSDAAAAVFVITQEDIRRSGVTHIAEALAMAPGLQVARISSSKWSVSSRGFAGYTSNKLLVMMDGRTVYSPAYSGTFWDMQNTLLEDIDRIEVIRGPGGTLWGANAVNGVINIITKKSSDTQGGLVRAGGGDQETAQGAVRYGGKLNETTDGRIYMSFNDRDSNVLAADGSDGNDGWQSFQAGFRLDGQVKQNSGWTFQGDLYRNDADQIIYPNWIETPPYLTSNYSEIEAEGANILGRYRHEFTGEDALTVQAYYDYNDRQEDFYQQTFGTIDLDIQYETEIGERNSLTMGGGYRQADGEFENSFQVQLGDSVDNLFSAFLQDEIKLVDDKLWLTLGAKWEHNDYTGVEWQPSGRVLWRPSEDHSLWGSVARAVRTPTIAEQKGSILFASYPTPFGTGTTYLRGNEDFDSEVVLAYEAGYRWQTTTNFSFDVAVFYNDYDGLYGIQPVVSQTGIDFTISNSAEGEAYGLEVTADWKPASWLSFILTYSFLDAESTRENSFFQDDNFESTLFQGSPQHQASLRSTISFAANWQANLWFRYVDQISVRNIADGFANETVLDDYFLADINIAWKITKDIEFMLAGQNLLDSSRLQYSSLLITPPTEIERSFYAKLTYRF